MLQKNLDNKKLKPSRELMCSGHSDYEAEIILNCNQHFRTWNIKIEELISKAELSVC